MKYKRDIDANRLSAGARQYGPGWAKVRAEHLELEPGCRMRSEECDGPLHVDHIVERARGGTDDHDNLRTLCRHHHNQRTGQDHGWKRSRRRAGVPA